MNMLMRSLYVLCWLLLCSWGAEALAADWQQTFPTPEIASYVETGRTRWMVVAAGTAAAAGTASARDAALALENALRLSGRTSLVMNDQSLGDISTLDDAALVKKASAFPVDGIAVVRVFPGAPGKPASAVVTLYNKAGELLTALAAEEGKPISAAQPTSGAGQGVTSVASEVASQVITTGMDPEAAEKKREEFETSAVSVDVLDLYNTAGVKLRSKILLYQGKFKKPLTPEEFYALAERPDLVAKAAAHREQLNQQKVGALLAMMGGGVIMVLPIYMASQTQTEPPNVIVSLAVGGVMTVGGSILWAHATKQDINPLTLQENGEVVDAYNKGLKKRLGLTSMLRPTPGASAPVLRLGFGLGQGHGTLVLHGDF